MSGTDGGWVVEHYGFADQAPDPREARRPARHRPWLRTAVAAVLLILGASAGTGAVAVAQAAGAPACPDTAPALHQQGGAIAHRHDGLR